MYTSSFGRYLGSRYFLVLKVQTRIDVIYIRVLCYLRTATIVAEGVFRTMSASVVNISILLPIRNVGRTRRLAPHLTLIKILQHRLAV